MLIIFIGDSSGCNNKYNGLYNNEYGLWKEPKKGNKINISCVQGHFCDDKRRSLKQAIIKKK